MLALRSGGGSGHVRGPEPRWALGFRIRKPPGDRPLLTFFHISEYHVASRTGGGPPCLPCRYGFPAVLAFSRTGLNRHGVTAVLAFSRTGLIPPVLVIP